MPLAAVVLHTVCTDSPRKHETEAQSSKKATPRLLAAPAAAAAAPALPKCAHPCPRLHGRTHHFLGSMRSKGSVSSPARCSAACYLEPAAWQWLTAAGEHRMRPAGT